MAGALSGYRVLEFGDHPAVAVLGMLLADQGADVVKVESPEGDPLRGTPVFAVWNRGKRSVAAKPDDTDLIRGLVPGADAIIEAFHSGRNPYGIDGESARVMRPRHHPPHAARLRRRASAVGYARHEPSDLGRDRRVQRPQSGRL